MTTQELSPPRLLDNSASADPHTLGSAVARKLAETQAWVEDTYGPNYHALFLEDAGAWQHYPPQVQRLGGRVMATILEETYPPKGEGYPLPEFIGEQFNTDAIAAGAVLPYFGLVAPRWLTNDAVHATPQLLVEHESLLHPVAVSARVVGDDGSQELGRSAKMPGYAGFRAGALVLQSYLDWHDGQSHAVRAEVRTASEHGAADGTSNIPSSAATQELYFGRLGLKPTRFLPAYVVGGQLEPFVVGENYKTANWAAYAQYFQVYTPPGDHINFLRSLSQEQTGQNVPLIVENGEGVKPYRYVKPPQLHGDAVYAKLEFTQDATGPYMDAQELSSSLSQIHDQVPAIMLKVPAHTPEGAATQAELMNQGFMVCGFEAAHESAGDNGSAPEVVPPVVYMVRLGEKVLSGGVKVAPAYFPDNLYTNDLRRQFQELDAKLRKTIQA